MNAPLKQKDLFTGGWRKVFAPSIKEKEIHESLVAQLRWRCRPGVIWFHPANGGWRPWSTAVDLKKMGVQPGVADLMFIWRLPMDPADMCRVLCLELKRHGGRQSPEQKQFQTECGVVGATYEVIDNIDTAIALLEGYGILGRVGRAAMES